LVPPIDDSSAWTIDFEKLEAAFTPRTRAFFFNTPNNPIGKVFTLEELEKLAEILRKWPDVAIVADEVYEHIVFDGRPHVSLCTLPGMFERSVTLSSAGKLFSITGWKTGWVVGGEALVRKISCSKVWASFCSNTPCQGGIARSLRIAENEYQGFPNYYAWLLNEYVKKREVLIRILKNSNKFKVQPLLSEGGFFLSARILDNGDFIPDKYKENATLDFAFCRWITEELKVSAIPCSAFFSDENKHFGETLVRFALCKDWADYEKAEKILLE
jgi:kynurenine--oxoglutarate transaminase/cysteine-S-conjugate beta-lyase/glutamine--phenylpyruvate transaminase